LWLRDEIVARCRELRRCSARSSNWANERRRLIPGYTHLQRAQPVYFAHHLLAYVEMLETRRGRLGMHFERDERLPAGQRRAGGLHAAAGSRVRRQAARLCRCQRQTARHAKLDGRRQRPRFRRGVLRAAALLAVHLSRLAEDVILWASAEFNFIKIADAYTTGSSLMPQKKNPDVAELTRGKSGRVIGNLMALLTLLKGLPMTYNRDLQEDKERLFDTADTVRACVH
jgi:argininosuccinate lyase